MKKKKSKEVEPPARPIEGPKVEGMDDDKVPDEHELDMHMNDILRAEGVKANHKIMKHLKPHMEKKMEQMKKITSIDELKRVAKQKSMED